MASEVEICNLALAHLGDDATIASIDPPEGSAQAEHCQRFYPIARDNLLELHDWNFASTRAALAQITSPTPSWRYAYVRPANCLTVRAILAPESVDDYVHRFDQTGCEFHPISTGQYTPQAFAQETLQNGTEIILTNQEDAVARYTARVTDPTKFSSLFAMTLSWHLASLLAGPVIKGDVGRAEAKRCMGMVEVYLNRGITRDTNQQQVAPAHVVSWMAGR
jgi:hypothetical protein